MMTDDWFREAKAADAPAPPSPFSSPAPLLPPLKRSASLHFDHHRLSPRLSNDPPAAASEPRALSFDAAAIAATANGSFGSSLHPPPGRFASHPYPALEGQHRSSLSTSSLGSSAGSRLSPMTGPRYSLHPGAMYWSTHRGSGGTPLSSPGAGSNPPMKQPHYDFMGSDGSHSPFTPPPHRTTRRTSTTSAPAPPPPPPPMSKVAEFMAQMLCYLWFASPSSLQRAPSPAPGGAPPTPDPSPMMPQGAALTQAQLVPEPDFVSFIENTLVTTQVSTSVVLLALLYVHRLKVANPITPLPTSERRVGIVALMLANKILDDHTYTAKTWADVTGLPLECLNKGELEFLEGLNFKLHVDIPAFEAWFRLLSGMVHLRHSIDAAASSKRRRGGRAQSRHKSPWKDGPAVLEGIVTPLRNAPSMRAASHSTDSRRGSDVSADDAPPKASLLGGRNVLPLPANVRTRARSSSPMAYLVRHPAPPAAHPPNAERPGSQDGLPRFEPQGVSAAAPHKRTVREALIDEEAQRSAKRSAASSMVDVNTPSPGQPPVYYGAPLPELRQGPRLPPMIVSPQGYEHRLGAPIQSGPVAGPSAELYFYSLAAGQRNGGQLMRHQHYPPQHGHPYVFGPPWQAAAMSYQQVADPVVDRRTSAVEVVPSHAGVSPHVRYFSHTGLPLPQPGAVSSDAWRRYADPALRPSSRSAFSSPLVHPMESLSIQRASVDQSAHPPPFQHPATQVVSEHAQRKHGLITPMVAPPPQYSNFSNAGLPCTVWSEGAPYHHLPAPPQQQGWRPEWDLQSQPRPQPQRGPPSAHW